MGSPATRLSKTMQGAIAQTILRIVICILAVLAITAVRFAIHVQQGRLLSVALNPFLIVVLAVAIRWGTRYAIFLSLVSALAFSWSLPPAGHFHLSDARVWTLLTACLVTGLVAGQLSSRARREAINANRRHAEAVAAQQRFADLVNSVEGIVWEADAETFVFSFVSEQAERILGYAANLWLSEPTFWKDQLHPEDRDWAVQFRSQAAADKRNRDFEYRMIASDGRAVWIRDLVTVVVENGRAIRLRGVMVDITKRKHGEKALKLSERNLAEAQRLTHTGSFVWDVKTREASYLSDEWYRIYELDPASNVRAWEQRLQHIHPEDRGKWEEAIDRAINEKSDYELEYRLLLSDGAIKYLHVVGHPILNSSGEAVQFMGSVTDISERKRAEEERERLRQLEAELAHINRVSTMGELTASLAHEVNQPIAAAMTNASTCLRWLAGETPNIEEARDAAKRIVKDATRAAEIISRIRLLFKKSTPERELVDLNEVINDIVGLLCNEAKRHDISVRTGLAEGLPGVIGDRIQLQQVLMNLMINSIDAMKEVDGSRQLTLSSQRDIGDQLLISVSDTGVGLPANKDEIFNAFVTTKPQGTGMGLAISRSILESHGGRLWADSNSGRGATFHFTLPTNTGAES
ncbi:MAG TPA: PAS domain-containing protein [Terriglobales bacterium]|nr:PAS domain-containing protein [Terriglobales bacterium]